jgi:RHS repeat-associated protein
MNSADTFNRELDIGKYSFNANDNFNADHTFDINGNKTEVFQLTPSLLPWIDMLGEKEFELSNHLGNVLVTVSDRKNEIPDANDNIDYYTADVLSAQDFYPFGMTMPGRKTAESYRFGFNSMENDDELKGQGNSLDFGARIYDPRTGRWLSLDPFMKKYPNESNYTFTSNSPLIFVDSDGKDRIIYLQVKLKDGTTINIATNRIINNQIRLHRDENFNGAASWYSTDVKQTLTLDLSTNTWSLSEMKSDYSNRYSYAYGLAKKGSAVLDAVNEAIGESNSNGEQASGWVLTSEFASFLDGAKTNTTEDEAKMVNIDAILIAMSSATKSGTLPKIKSKLGPASITNLARRLVSKIEGIKGENKDTQREPSGYPYQFEYHSGKDWHKKTKIDENDTQVIYKDSNFSTQEVKTNAYTKKQSK